MEPDEKDLSIILANINQGFNVVLEQVFKEYKIPPTECSAIAHQYAVHFLASTILLSSDPEARWIIDQNIITKRLKEQKND